MKCKLTHNYSSRYILGILYSLNKVPNGETSFKKNNLGKKINSSENDKIHRSPYYYVYSNLLTTH